MEVVRNVYREDHELFRTTVRRFLERECLPRQESWLADGIVDRETWQKAGREGRQGTSCRKSMAVAAATSATRRSSPRKWPRWASA